MSEVDLLEEGTEEAALGNQGAAEPPATPETAPAQVSEEVQNQGLPPSGDPGGEQAQEQHTVTNQATLMIDEVTPVDELRKVMEVTIMKPGPAMRWIGERQVDYTEDALRNSVPMWEGAAAFNDHGNKSVTNITGVYFAPWYDGGVKARLRFTDCSMYYMVKRCIEERAQGLPVPDIGISADIILMGAPQGDFFVVSDIVHVISADIVFAPAAGGSFDRVLNSLVGEGLIPSGESGITEGESVPLATEGLENADKRIRDLQGAADRLRNQVSGQEDQITRLQDNLTQAVIRYRNGILRDNPEIPEHMVTGSTVEELDASLEEARTVVNSVRQHLEEQVPAGAPARTGVDVDALSPRQKIEYGVTHGHARRKS